MISVSNIVTILVAILYIAAVDGAASCQSFPVLTVAAQAATFLCYGIVDYDFYMPDGMNNSTLFIFIFHLLLYIFYLFFKNFFL